MRCWRSLQVLRRVDHRCLWSGVPPGSAAQQSFRAITGESRKYENSIMKTRTAILSQIFALVLGCAAAIWGVTCVYWAAFPGPCGDHPGPSLFVIMSGLVDVPVGVLALAIGWFAKNGSPRLRRISIAASLVTLSLPVITSLFVLRSPCP